MHRKHGLLAIVTEIVCLSLDLSGDNSA